jgi:hypothetical protein
VQRPPTAPKLLIFSADSTPNIQTTEENFESIFVSSELSRVSIEANRVSRLRSNSENLVSSLLSKAAKRASIRFSRATIPTFSAPGRRTTSIFPPSKGTASNDHDSIALIHVHDVCPTRRLLPETLALNDLSPEPQQDARPYKGRT